MDCLIIAAGAGTRIRSISDSKPLTRFGNSFLIDHVILRALTGGAERFVVVTGYRGQEVHRHLEKLALARDIDMSCVRNEDHEEPNGHSVLAARDLLPGPFLLTMCDHLLDPDIIRDLIACPIGREEVILATDNRLDNPDVDLEDVTRVLEEDGYIREIGKFIEPYNAFDTGLFLANPSLFGAIDQSIAETADASLSAGIRCLAERNLARTHLIGDRFWIDVDDEVAFQKATKHILT